MVTHGWSNVELAAIFGISEATVRKWRKGESMLGAEELYILWKDHSLSMDWFFSGYPPILREEKRRVTIGSEYEVINKDEFLQHLTALQELLTKVKKDV